MITIAPDYDLFLKILLALWVLRGMFNLVGGIVGMDLPKREKAGAIEIIFGIVVLLSVAWIVI
jgi:hypothetical protein